MVFHHRCLPLSVSLREAKAAGTGLKNGGSGEFTELLNVAIKALVTGDPGPLDEAWDYEYESLFTAVADGKKRLFPFCHAEQQVKFLGARTYWYGRLRTNSKRMVRNLLKKRGGVSHLKEILHTVDGVMSTLIISFPEILVKTVPSEHEYSRSDRIINNIISNCLFNYSRVVKQIKAFRKELKKAAFEKRELSPSDKWRCISWANSIVKEYNKIASSNSRAKMFRISAFCQTRSTGLGDSKMVQETIDEFVETVTKKREFTPSPALARARDEVISETVLNATGRSPHFRISMSTAGCLESGRSKEGKFGYLRDLVRQGDVPEPAPFSITNPGGDLGTPIWREALELADAGDRNITTVNVVGVRENGKVRVVTSGSFWKDSLLQPFSHLTIEMAKSNRILRDGFRARRLGYTFAESINILDADRGDVIWAEDPIAVSCDWTKATDNPPHESGRFVMGPLLKGIGLTELQIENILYAWVGDYDLWIDGKRKGVMVNGIPMGNPLTKTNLSLAHPICDRYAKNRIQDQIGDGTFIRDWKKGRTETIGAGNGDDMVFFAWGQFKTEYVEYYMEAAASLGYLTSEMDFFVTRDWCTYCEEVFRIPTSRFDTVALANRLKDSRYSPTLDFPKGRLIIDTRKDRSDFSSEPEGKYTLLGKDMEYVRKDSGRGVNLLFAIASASQDVCLSLNKFRKPVYVPRQWCSIGKMPPNWDIRSWCNAVKSQGRWARNLTLTVLEEYLGIRPKDIILLRGVVSSGQKHFTREAVVEINTIPDTDPIKSRRVLEAADWGKFPIGVVEKLVGAGALIPESRITAQYLFHSRIKSLSQDAYGSDLFQHIKTVGYYLSEFSEEKFIRVATRFVTKYRGRPWELSNSTPEDLYPESVMTDLQKADPLRVDLPLEYLKRFDKQPKPDSPYERGVRELYEWFTDSRIDVLDGRPHDPPPRQVIEDDPILIQTAANLAAGGSDMIIFVTDDKKMAAKARNTIIGSVFYRISCRDWVSIAGDQTSVEKFIRSKYRSGIRFEFLIDTGSLETFMDKTGSSYSLGVPYKAISPPGWADEITRSPPPTNQSMLEAYRRRSSNSDDVIASILMLSDRRDKLSDARLTRST